MSDHEPVPAGTPERRPGRPRDAVRDETTIGEDGIVSCNRCNKVIGTQGISHVERVKMHFRRRCSGGTATATITNYFQPAVTPALEDAFHHKFAEWIYTTGVSFNVVSNPLLAQALAMVNPTLRPRYELATRLLDDAYDYWVARLVNTATGRMCSLVTDGWTDVNGQPGIKYVLIVSSSTFFLESAYTGSTSLDTTFLANDVERVINNHSYAKCVQSLPTARRSIRPCGPLSNRSFRRCFFHGCASHTLHLMVKDIVTKLSWLSDTAESCRAIIRFFKKHPMLGSVLREEQDRTGLPRLALPGDTRWCSLEKAFVTVRKSDEILLRIVSSRDFLDVERKKRLQRRQIQAWVQEPDFAKRLQKGAELLDVLSAYLPKFERNTTPVSDVYALVLLIEGVFQKQQLSVPDRQQIKCVIEDRFDLVYGDAHGVAYLLDPRYCGKGMDPATRRDVEDFISGWHGEAQQEGTVVELGTYLAMVRELDAARSIKLRLVKEKRLSVRDFWAGLDGLPLLQDLALYVFACV